MTKCDDGCGRYACQTWDTDRRTDPRTRFKALCGSCWKVRDDRKRSVFAMVVQAELVAKPEATSQGL